MLTPGIPRLGKMLRNLLLIGLIHSSLTIHAQDSKPSFEEAKNWLIEKLYKSIKWQGGAYLEVERSDYKCYYDFSNAKYDSLIIIISEKDLSGNPGYGIKISAYSSEARVKSGDYGAFDIYIPIMEIDRFFGSVIVTKSPTIWVLGLNCSIFPVDHVKMYDFNEVEANLAARMAKCIDVLKTYAPAKPKEPF